MLVSRDLRLVLQYSAAMSVPRECGHAHFPNRSNRLPLLGYKGAKRGGVRQLLIATAPANRHRSSQSTVAHCVRCGRLSAAVAEAGTLPPATPVFFTIVCAYSCMVSICLLALSV